MAQAVLQAADEPHAPSRGLVACKFAAESLFYFVRWLQDIVLSEESNDIIKVSVRKIFHHQIGTCLL